jgi:RsiW-degrading membrane proteinase PrsW (M82 family)
MPLEVVAFVLLAAVLHASWNARLNPLTIGLRCSP